MGSTSQENINIVVKLQKRAAQLIVDADFSIGSRLLFRELELVLFQEIVQFNHPSLFIKCIINIVPIYLQDMFHHKSNDHTYMLRSSNWPIKCIKKTQKLIDPKLKKNCYVMEYVK